MDAIIVSSFHAEFFCILHLPIIQAIPFTAILGAISPLDSHCCAVACRCLPLSAVGCWLLAASLFGASIYDLTWSCTKWQTGNNTNNFKCMQYKHCCKYVLQCAYCNIVVSSTALLLASLCAELFLLWLASNVHV